MKWGKLNRYNKMAAAVVLKDFKASGVILSRGHIVALARTDGLTSTPPLKATRGAPMIVTFFSTHKDPPPSPQRSQKQPMK